MTLNCVTHRGPRRGNRQTKLASHCLLRTGLVLGLLALQLAGCGTPSTPTPTPTPIPTPTAVPTATPIPTPTAIPPQAWVQNGDDLLVESDFAAAEVAYRHALEADPNHAPAYIGLARVCRAQVGREEEQLAHARKAVELAPDNAVAQAMLSDAYMVTWAFADAVTAAEKAAEMDSKDAFVQSILAEAYLFDRQYEAGRKAVEAAVSLDPKLTEAWCALGVYYRETGQWHRAQAAIEQAIALEPRFAPWHSLLGSLLNQTDNPTLAIPHYERALELAPNDTLALLGLASVAMDRHNYQEAEKYVQRVVELLPEDPRAYVVWGQLYLKQDQADDALAQFRKALSKRDQYFYAMEGITDISLHEMECESMARQAQELTDLQPRMAAGRLYLGMAKICSGDVNKALEYSRKALELEPYNPSAYYLQGLAYASQGRWEDATLSYVQGLRLSPERAELHVALGQLLVAQGEMDQARTEYEVALKLNPTLPDAHVGLSEILLAEDKESQAQSHAEQALALEKTNDTARQLLGGALLGQGMSERATEVLKELVEDEPENARGHFYLGLAYRNLKRYSEAQKEVETYVALYPDDVNIDRIENLAAVLGQGYVLAESKAIADTKELLAEWLGIEVSVKVEEVKEQGRTMTISFAAEEDQEQKDLVTEMSLALAVAAMQLPRVDPAVTNGLVVQVDEDGKPTYRATVTLSDMTDFSDGATSGPELLAQVQFSRAVGPEKMASVKEIESGLSETRELEAKQAVPFHSLKTEDLQNYISNSMDAKAREAMRTSDALLTLLGVIGPDVDLATLLQDLYAEQVAGFYNHKEEAFYLVEDTEQTASDQMVVAHEYTHALQDQHFGLDQLGDEDMDSDQYRAFEALIEGDATLAMLLYGNEHIALVDLLQSISGAGGLQSQVLDSSPTFVQGMEMFPYQTGLDFVVSLYQSGDWSAVDEAYDSPPQSTEQVLHPERYREKDLPQKVTMPDLAAALGSDWQVVEGDVMGELGLLLALAQDMGPAAAARAAEGWGGDSYALLQQGSAQPSVLVMHTYWDDQDSADEFWALYEVCIDHRADHAQQVKELVGEVHSRWWLYPGGTLYAQQEGRYVTIIVAPDEQTVDKMSALLKP